MTKSAPLTKVAELYGLPTFQPGDWKAVAAAQHCPFLNRKCLKNRKSEPEITIGACTMIYGRQPQPVMICPFRLLERSQVFSDCLHLLKLHEPGNELRIVAGLAVPGGSIDYCLSAILLLTAGVFARIFIPACEEATITFFESHFAAGRKVSGTAHQKASSF
jgi:hypothetical protein